MVPWGVGPCAPTPIHSVHTQETTRTMPHRQSLIIAANVLLQTSFTFEQGWSPAEKSLNWAAWEVYREACAAMGVDDADTHRAACSHLMELAMDPYAYPGK